jgi:UDP-N-acetylmuramoylalanine--D-glutamate ligase
MDQCSVLILGVAREGATLARYFRDRGGRVIVTDRAPPDRLQSSLQVLGSDVEAHLGADFPELVELVDRFFVSPGVPADNPVYAAARRRGLAIESMTTLFFELCPAPIVGVTGSSGKTTTTSLIGHILREIGEPTVVGGNIGDPMLALLPSIGPRTRVVLELSSFQLEILVRSPHIAVVTNISPNHLDRHRTMGAYVAAKQRIVRYQRPRDVAVLNAGDEHAGAFQTAGEVLWFGSNIGHRNGVTVEAGSIVRRKSGHDTAILDMPDVPLLGRHNAENVLAALAAIDALGIPLSDVTEAVESFRSPPHRLQVIAERGGVRYIDDSIATSPARASVALEALTGPVILIAGGRDKNLPWDDFARLAAHRAHAVVLIGEAAGLIDRAIRACLNGSGSLRAKRIRCCNSLAEAVAEASRIAKPGDTVLLSPGCTSFDMFTNFEERGAAFLRAVEALDAA